MSIVMVVSGSLQIVGSAVGQRPIRISKPSRPLGNANGPRWMLPEGYVPSGILRVFTRAAPCLAIRVPLPSHLPRSEPRLDVHRGALGALLRQFLLAHRAALQGLRSHQATWFAGRRF